MTISQISFGSFKPIKTALYALVGTSFIGNGVGTYVNKQSEITIDELHRELQEEKELNKKQAEQISNLQAGFEDYKAKTQTTLNDKVTLDQIPKVVNEIKKLTVQVQNAKVTQVDRYTQKIETETGSGSILIGGDKRYILTNAHNLTDVSKNKVYSFSLYNGTDFEKPESFEAKIAVLPNGNLAHSKEHDTALLEIPQDVKLLCEESIVFRDMSKNKLEEGEFVIVSGDQCGEKDSITFGIVSHTDRKMILNEKEMKNHYIQTDAAINVSCSGGGMYDIYGRYIGMDNLKHGKGEEICYAIRGDSIQELLTEWGISFKTK